MIENVWKLDYHSYICRNKPRKMTLGEKRMRIGVTTQAGTATQPATPAYEIQVLAAQLIDKINELKTNAGTQEDIGEFKRNQATAMTYIEIGAMMGVKAAT